MESTLGWEDHRFYVLALRDSEREPPSLENVKGKAGSLKKKEYLVK